MIFLLHPVFRALESIRKIYFQEYSFDLVFEHSYCIQWGLQRIYCPEKILEKVHARFTTPKSSPGVFDPPRSTNISNYTLIGGKKQEFIKPKTQKTSMSCIRILNVFVFAPTLFESCPQVNHFVDNLCICICVLYLYLCICICVFVFVYLFLCI